MAYAWPDDISDIDMVECDCCGKLVPVEDIIHIRMPNAAGCETFSCEACCEKAKIW